jgi:hypothetical protein
MSVDMRQYLEVMGSISPTISRIQSDYLKGQWQFGLTFNTPEGPVSIGLGILPEDITDRDLDIVVARLKQFHLGLLDYVERKLSNSVLNKYWDSRI